MDTPPQLPLNPTTDIPPPTCCANLVSNAWQIPNYPQSWTLPTITTTSYPSNSLFPVVYSTTQLLNSTSSHIPATSYSPSSTLLLVPAQLRQQILQGEYVDFAMLLHKATFSDVLEIPALSSRQPVIKAITSFDTWMQAWNLYPSVLLANNPSRAVELFGYIPMAHLLAKHSPSSPFMATIRMIVNFVPWQLRTRCFAGTNDTLIFG